MNTRIPPTPRTDSGWSWADFWNWYRTQPLDVQQWTFNTNDLLTVISAMAEDVQNEALYYAPTNVQVLFAYGMDPFMQKCIQVRQQIKKIMEDL